MKASPAVAKRGTLRVFRLAGLLCALAAGRVSAQGTLSTILTNGPTANRLNIVVLSEGYQAGELGKFLTDATSAVNHFLASPPYQEYRTYFNFFAIAVASAQSGSDHYTPTVSLVNTYFNSTFDSYGTQRLLTIPPNDHDSTYADGQGKVDALLQALMPEYDLVAMVVNDTTYGGSGGSVLITSVNSSAPEIVVHESGHTFGGLTDEYSSAYPGWVPKEYPNATAQTNRASIKWASWVAGNTPLPTPSVSPYTSDVVGLFRGAEYQTNGWYRPRYDCKMNHLGISFCEVCGEQLVKCIYQAVRSIDSFSPATTNFSIDSSQAISFSVTPLQPQTHNLSVQWFTNGIAVTGATLPTFALLPQNLGIGTNLVQAQVHDATSLVRTDPSRILTDSVTWRVNVSPAQLRLVAPQWLAGGQLSLCVTGTAPRGFVIQASTNLLSWVPAFTNSVPLASSQLYYTNSSGTFPQRFFRAVVGP